MQIEPYLFFDGQCEAALNFYAQCLGGQIAVLHRYEGSPMEAQLSP
jgi:PhnB protein